MTEQSLRSLRVASAEFSGIRATLLAPRRVLGRLEREQRATPGRSLGVAQFVGASARWHIAILSKDAVAGHEHVTGRKIRWHLRPGGVARVVRDASPGLMVGRSERGVPVRAPRVVVPSIVDRGDGTGCEKAERQNESCESVLLQHDSPPLFGSKASSRCVQFIAGAAKLKTRAGVKISLSCRYSVIKFSRLPRSTH
jgi:hypothetical protein